jgi:cytochrome d ubiquinol oxidase subunit II
MTLDYDTLRLIWWAVLVTIACGFAVLDGFDLGIATLLPFLGKTDDERRVIVNTIGPTWEANQVWLVMLVGASFAAWPLVYAVVFPALYFALFALLVALALRPLGFDYRGKLPAANWRSSWDWCLFAGGIFPAFILSLALGNLLLGLQFRIEDDVRVSYSGGLLDLFRPFAVFCGVLGVVLFCQHGAVYLHWRSGPPIAERARSVGQWCAVVFVTLFLLAGLWVHFGIQGHAFLEDRMPNALSNPLSKSVYQVAAAWTGNFHQHPGLLAVPVAAVLGAVLAAGLLKIRWAGAAFVSSAVSVLAAVLTAAVSMFPFMVPSVSDPRSSLTVWDASASEHTLNLLSLAIAVFLPVVLAYTAWVYRVLRGKITVEQVREQSNSLY